jgi:hypothetical protein
MRLRDSVVRVLSLVLTSSLVLTVSAQSPRATISGNVTDPDGKGVAGAQVQAKNEAGAEFHAKSSPSGGYSLTQLPSGTYQVTVLSSGLVPFEKQNVKVEAGATVRLDALLQDFISLGAVGEDRTFFGAALDPHDAPTGPTPRTPDGKPDFSGAWNTLRFVDPGNPEPLAWAEALSKERVANNLKDMPTARCLPYGITLSAFVFPFRIMQNATIVALLYEEDLPRLIYLDGRKHPEETLTPFVGHSVGRWEGDTLVVDTVDFNDKTWLDTVGHPHTDKMHVIEHYRRKDLGHLEVDVTIDDPGAYKKPWTIKRASELAPPNLELGQYVCTENNRDLPHLVGK